MSQKSISYFAPKASVMSLLVPIKKKCFLADTIQSIITKFGIITRKGSKFTLYDSYLQKKTFKQMRSVYFYRNGIEMLNNQGAAYYTINGERIEKIPKNQLLTLRNSI